MTSVTCSDGIVVDGVADRGGAVMDSVRKTVAVGAVSHGSTCYASLAAACTTVCL